MTDLWKRRIAAIVAVSLALLTLGWVSYGSLGENLVYYWSPTELVQKSAEAQGATVRLGGLVVPGTYDMKKCHPGCSFRVTDGQTDVAVETDGVPPAMFREGIGVVLEGELQGAVFRSDRVMIKHNNEYKPPAPGEKPPKTWATLEDGQ
jgi:cytochrome c-type biogenesis protein CcmE